MERETGFEPATNSLEVCIVIDSKSLTNYKGVSRGSLRFHGFNYLPIGFAAPSYRRTNI